MGEEKEIELINALADFVIRVAKGKATSEKEVEVLPEVARVVADYYLHSINRC